MTATTVDRNSPALYIERQIKLPLKTSTADIPAGVMVCVDATGTALNAADTAGLKIMGRSAAPASYSGGDRFVVVERGVFYFANDGTIAQANVGGAATIADNQTLSLAATTTNDIIAGYVEAVDSNGVAIAILGGLPAAA